jgi:PAS domain S-box-containing protein
MTNPSDDETDPPTVARLRERIGQLERELSESRFVQALIRSIDTQLKVPMYWKDREHSYRWTNDAFALAVAHPRAEILGRADEDLFSETEARERREDDVDILTKGEAIATVRVVERLGRSITIETLRIPIVEDDHAIVGLVGIERDITSRAAALAELEQDRLLLQIIMDTLPDSIYFKGPDNRFLRINHATAKKFGVVDPHDVVGKSDFDMFSAEHASEAFEDEKRILATGDPIIAKEERETWPGGRISWVSTTKVPVRHADGRILGTFGVTRDITPRKRAQIALEASERRYRELIENANDVIYTHDLAGAIKSLNKAGQIVSGYSLDEACQLNVNDLVAPGYLGDAMEMTRRKLRGIPTTTYEIEIVGKAGRRIPLEVNTQILFEDGKPVAVQGIGRDITERRRANEALRQQAELLAEQAHQLEQRHIDLSAAYRHLQETESQLIHSEKMAAVGQLIAGLAHEINNPATFVLTNLTTIERDVEDILRYADTCEQASPATDAKDNLTALRQELAIEEATGELRALLASCRTGMHRIRDLVANLRSYSRIETQGRYEIADLREGVDATLVLLRPVIPKGVAVRVDADDPPAVECNLGQINQVFMNIIVNAVQAIGDIGNVVIRIEKADDGVVTRISDDGSGIPAEIRHRIFDPFFTTKEVGKGTGLGLGICQKIIANHRGRIDLESTVGRGTTFHVWLPLRQPTASPQES